MRASFYFRLGALALLGVFVTYSAPAHAWGYGHGQLQVTPSGEVTGIDTTPENAVHEAETPNANVPVNTAYTPATETPAGTANAGPYAVNNNGTTTYGTTTYAPAATPGNFPGQGGVPVGNP